MMRYIKSAQAEEEKDTRYDDLLDSIKDDYDYLIDSFDKLNRAGKLDSVLAIMNDFSNTLNDYVDNSIAEIRADGQDEV